MIDKLILTAIIFNFQHVEASKLEPGWMGKRNYTDYCHGGDYESGITEKESGVGVSVWIDNETRCKLRLSYKQRPITSRFGSDPPEVILPADCGVFWAHGKLAKGTTGAVHYMCLEYAIVFGLEWSVPYWGKNEFAVWAKGYGNAQNVFTIEHDSTPSGRLSSFNVFMTEKKRYCPCMDLNILETHKYSYYSF